MFEILGKTKEKQRSSANEEEKGKHRLGMNPYSLHAAVEDHCEFQKMVTLKEVYFPNELSIVILPYRVVNGTCETIKSKK